MKPLLLIATLLVGLYSKSQIVNIEKERFVNDTTGWAGSGDFGFSFGKQQNTFYTLYANAHVQYKNEKNLYLLLGSYEMIKGKSEKILNGGFLHFRYNYKIRNWVRWEAFTQIQHNELTALKLRYLIGTGPRFKLSQKEKYKFYLGYHYMFEYEINEAETEKLKQHRVNAYLSFTIKPNDIVELTSTTYYQPLISNMKDYRITTDNAIHFSINSFLSLYMSYRLTYDAVPPIGSATKLTYLWNNGLSFEW
ncbi:MAG: DUF481 domain-containing protein [Chitinophagales bacterium]|nr:DUF481 domain-containing protein [Chitinophagales bacterium]